MRYDAWSVGEVESVFERSFDRAFDKVRTEGRIEGQVDGMREILQRQAAKKFGLSRQAALSELIAGLQTADHLEGAAEFLLDCEDADEFVRLLQRNSRGG